MLDRARVLGTVAATISLAALLMLGSAQTALGIWEDPDFIEKLFGPPNINGIVGNGQLLAGVSKRGELTLLRWPNPSFYDQVRYLTISRELPRFGAKENYGSFAGLVVRDADGVQSVLWFRDPPWECRQSHPEAHSASLVTRCTHPAFGIEVEQRDFVVPHDDVLVRRYEIVRSVASPEVVAFIYFENMAPCTKKIPLAPIHDWLLDSLNDFGLAYIFDGEALLHFRPYGDPQTPAAVPTDPYAIDAVWPNGGVFIAIGSDRKPSAYQCGNEKVDGGPLTDAYINSQGGQLLNNAACVGRCTGALAFDLDPDATEHELSILFALSDSAQSAVNLLDGYRNRAIPELADETDEYWKSWLDEIPMPDTDDERLLFVCKHGLIAIKQVADARTGAIMAASSTQPPYAQDWPRDGAFINYALELAGLYEMVELHNAFYLSVQRESGTLGMAYYSDGMNAGPIPFEIDEVALVVWTWWQHSRFIDDPDARAEYLSAVYPGIKRAAEFLVRWEDADTGLPKPVWETDYPLPTQTISGAIAAYQGLTCAIEAAKEAGEDEQVIASWQARLDRLIDAIWTYFYDSVDEQFLAWLYSKAWLIWPAGFIEPGDKLTEEVATEIFEETMFRLHKGVVAGSYEGLITLALARLWQNEPEKLELLKEPLWIQAHELATDTGLFGEWWLLVDRDGDGVWEFENHAGFPHVETSALLYATALLVYGAAEADEEEDERQEDVEPSESVGCGCWM